MLPRPSFYETQKPPHPQARERAHAFQNGRRESEGRAACKKNTHKTSAGPGVRLGAKTRRRQHPRKPAGQPAARLSDRARRGLPLKIALSRMASRAGSCRAKRACQNLSAGNTCVAASSLRGRQRRETMGRLLQQEPPARPLNRCARAQWRVVVTWCELQAALQRSRAGIFAALPLPVASRCSLFCIGRKKRPGEHRSADSCIPLAFPARPAGCTTK